MNENEKKNGWLPILGYVALIVVLFIGIKVVFAGLGRAIPKTEDVQPQFTALDNREGQQVSYGLRLLTDEEAQSEEVRKWLEQAQEQAEPDAGAYWLVRLEEDDYLLCLPGQDRSLSASSFTATEERDPDGMIALVLRVRTPETGESVEPRAVSCFACAPSPTSGRACACASSWTAGSRRSTSWQSRTDSCIPRKRYTWDGIDKDSSYLVGAACGRRSPNR